MLNGYRIDAIRTAGIYGDAGVAVDGVAVVIKGEGIADTIRSVVEPESKEAHRNCQWFDRGNSKRMTISRIVSSEFYLIF